MRRIQDYAHTRRGLAVMCKLHLLHVILLLLAACFLTLIRLLHSLFVWSCFLFDNMCSLLYLICPSAYVVVPLSSLFTMPFAITPHFPRCGRNTLFLILKVCVDVCSCAFSPGYQCFWRAAPSAAPVKGGSTAAPPPAASRGRSVATRTERWAASLRVGLISDC